MKSQRVNGNDETSGGCDDDYIEGEAKQAMFADSDDDRLQAQIIGQTVASVVIDWNLIPGADVYRIEQHHPSQGWLKVGWRGDRPATADHLDENFTYRFRVKALRYCPTEDAYVDLCTSPEVVGRTLSDQPSTLCLHRAIRKGQQFLVKRLLRRRPSLIEYPGPNGYLPLANAIAAGEISIIDVLLTAGASVHIGDSWNRRTPLHLAFYHGRLPVARMLLNKKAALEARDANGLTACHFAVDGNQCEMLRFALENGADTEARDASGWTLLLRAVVMRSDLALLKLLVQHGADPLARDLLDQTCVDLARMYDNQEAGNYLAKVLQKQKLTKEAK